MDVRDRNGGPVSRIDARLVHLLVVCEADLEVLMLFVRLSVEWWHDGTKSQWQLRQLTMTWKHNDDKLRRHFTIWYIFNLEIAERCWLDSSNADWLWLTGGYVAILATYFLVLQRFWNTDVLAAPGHGSSLQSRSRGNINLDGTVLTPAAAARGTRPHHHRTRLLPCGGGDSRLILTTPGRHESRVFMIITSPFTATHTNSRSFSKFVIRI